jgi:hypothetical protein
MAKSRQLRPGASLKTRDWQLGFHASLPKRAYCWNRADFQMDFANKAFPLMLDPSKPSKHETAMATTFLGRRGPIQRMPDRGLAHSIQRTGHFRTGHSESNHRGVYNMVLMFVKAFLVAVQKRRIAVYK